MPYQTESLCFAWVFVWYDDSMKDMLLWNVYEISSDDSSLNGVMLRGRIRKLGIEKDINVLAENTEDSANGVRFAVLSSQDAETITAYLQGVISDVNVQKVLDQCPNPVLSKLKVNITSRYTL
jgi:hypothetical protein